MICYPKPSAPSHCSARIVSEHSNILQERWEQMEQLYHNDLVGAIGLRDCTVYQLQQLMASSKLAPSVVSVEIHPYHNNWDLKKFCKKQVAYRTYCQHLPK